MDRRSHRERMRGWIAVGVREGLTFGSLAQRSGVNEKTLRRWNEVFRAESAGRVEPDREERAFVELIERGQTSSSRIEILLPDKRRIVIDGASLVEVLGRLIAALGRC